MHMILGVDEAGRGPLAGPLAVGVVAFSEDVVARFNLATLFPGLNDSKKLSEKKREEIFVQLQTQIKEGSIRAVVCFSSAAMIDERGVTYAVAHALNRGVRKLAPEPANAKVYLDGSLCAPKEYEQETIVGGDGLVPAIMLASIAAKVTRDRLMRKLAKEYPQYGFEIHKGYGTKAHYEALALHGPCDIHRKLFLRKLFAASK